MTDLETFLRRSPATNEQRAALWDAFEESANEDELASRLESISVPKTLKAGLWDLKASLAVESVPDQRGLGGAGGMAFRAGAQVLAPKNPQAVLDSAVEAGSFVNAVPGAVASVYRDIGVGALKGLGGMANTAMGAIGIPMPEYSETAFDPSGPVEAGGKELAQTAVTAPLAGPVISVAGKVLKPIASRIIPVTKAVAEFAGIGERARKAQKVYRAATGADEAAAMSRKAARAESVAQKSAIKEAKQIQAVEDKVLRRELSDAKKMDKGTLERMKHTVKQAQKESPEVGSYAADEAARAARQKEHIAESYRKKAEKEAKNVAEGEDLEAKLRASLKPKGKPVQSDAMAIANDLAERIRDLTQNQGMSPGQIKDILRENHGIPNKYASQMVNMVLADLKKGK